MNRCILCTQARFSHDGSHDYIKYTCKLTFQGPQRWKRNKFDKKEFDKKEFDNNKVVH